MLSDIDGLSAGKQKTPKFVQATSKYQTQRSSDSLDDSFSDKDRRLILSKSDDSEDNISKLTRLRDLPTKIPIYRFTSIHIQHFFCAKHIVRHLMPNLKK